MKYFKIIVLLCLVGVSYHMKEGKSNLDFSEFGSHSAMRQTCKLPTIEDEAMPSLYFRKLIHKKARFCEK